MNTKELTIAVKLLGAKIRKFSTLEIKNAEDYQHAANILKQVHEVEKEIKKEKSTWLEPIKEMQALVDSHFKPVLEHVEFLKADTKNKMLAFVEKQQKEEEEIRKKLEAGKITVKTALKKIEAIEQATKTRQIESIEIVDVAKIPRQYLMPDMTKIKEALKAGRKIPGVEVVKKTIIVA